LLIKHKKAILEKYPYAKIVSKNIYEIHLPTLNDAYVLGKGKTKHQAWKNAYGNGL
jgi:hypothetical protein